MRVECCPAFCILEGVTLKKDSVRVSYTQLFLELYFPFNFVYVWIGPSVSAGALAVQKSVLGPPFLFIP